ncbi:MAG: cytochrome c-type biogenesis protein [Phototrophicaceae bacterium]
MLVIALLLIALPVAAQNDADPAPPPDDSAREVTHDEVNAVASQLYCPVCENEPLHTCMAPACVQWRAEIRRQLSQGQTNDQVISYFVTTYGDRVVGIPQDPTLRGLSLAAPVAVVLLALVLSGLTFWRWRARRQDEPSAVPAGPTNPDDNDYRSQVERDLQY